MKWFLSCLQKKLDVAEKDIISKTHEINSVLVALVWSFWEVHINGFLYIRGVQQL